MRIPETASSIRDTFAALRRRGEMALIPYVTAGYPTLDASMRALREIADCGADLVELGVPFSDPVADGPTIQRASQKALENGVRLAAILEAVERTDFGVPPLLMSYLNPLLSYGRERVLSDMSRAGFAGLIVPDLPVEESGRWSGTAAAHGIDLVLLLAPTSSDARAAKIAARSRGFVYHVSVTGTTGVREGLADDLLVSLSRTKRLTDTPVAVGFGISTAEQIRRLRGVADGVVVGSRIVDALQRGEDPGALIRELKQATRRAKPC